MALRFTKMHGAGNDFIVLDLRDGSPAPGTDTLARMADRHFGVGCDQVMLLEPPAHADALASYRVVNGDGSFARQCGNGVRCLAAWLHREGDLSGADVLDSPSGPVPVRVVDDGDIEVLLGSPNFSVDAIPLLATADADGGYRLDIDGIPLRFGAVSMGNPHVVIEVDDVLTAPVELAFALQAHHAFPEGCNVGFAQVVADDRIRLRVIERGVGETLACGSGACAAHAWLHRAGRVGASTRVELPGGTLGLEWAGAAGEPVRMRGPTAFVFEGHWTS
jgi:diaminopimelate epimerase